MLESLDNKEVRLKDINFDDIFDEIESNIWNWSAHGKNPPYKVKMTDDKNELKIDAIIYAKEYDCYESDVCITLNDRVLFQKSTRSAEAYKMFEEDKGYYTDKNEVVRYLVNTLEGPMLVKVNYDA